jgi:hypothetical protein
MELLILPPTTILLLLTMIRHHQTTILLPLTFVWEPDMTRFYHRDYPHKTTSTDPCR